jgi:hypothetical protein
MVTELAEWLGLIVLKEEQGRVEDLICAVAASSRVVFTYELAKS